MRNMQPIYQRVPIDGHEHRLGEYCVGCAQLNGQHSENYKKYIIGEREYTTELDEAIKLANRVLDRPSGDPDDTSAILSRQFLKANEMRNALLDILDCAYQFKDLPCNLYSAIANASCFAPNQDQHDIVRLMDAARYGRKIE